MCAKNLDWGYTEINGPDKWASLCDSFTKCAKGKAQSPIDLTDNDVTYSDKNTLAIDYKFAPLTFKHDQFTALTIDRQNMVVSYGRSIQINFPDNSQEKMQFENVQYKLIQFHFHIPGEHQINGASFPGEIHFVNQSQNDLAVIAVFMKAGRENPNIQRILDNLHSADEVSSEVKIDPSELIPHNQSYYTYMGSLTIPPCIEKIRWIVMENPIEASTKQIQQLRAAIGEDNVRPIQPLNGRKVFYVKTQTLNV